MIPPEPVCGRSTELTGARSDGGEAGGVTGSRSQPIHGPPSSMTTNIPSDQRVISIPSSGAQPSSEAIRAPCLPPVEDERLLELVERVALAQSLVIGVDSPTCAVLGVTGITVDVVLDLGRHRGHAYTSYERAAVDPLEQGSCQ
jgi:hypothetical protein